MNASDLEFVWRSQPPIKPSPQNIAQIAARVCAEDRKFRRRIWWRDLREIAAALSVAVVFGWVGQSWLRWVSVASCLFVVAVLLGSRRVLRPIHETSSVVERLHQMIRETETQIGLLRSVLWWYLLPCGVATVAFLLDRMSLKFSPSHLLLFAATMCPFYIAVYWLNQRAVRKVLLPRRANLQHALGELEQQS
jgi:hypothetical protein